MLRAATSPLLSPHAGGAASEPPQATHASGRLDRTPPRAEKLVDDRICPAVEDAEVARKRLVVPS
eukprot:CAMPEP_0181241244 /NCGR_PEP_ID=MMETSP1096-20121128/41011_1 /TAXON_ID=156174 ORGANISM="Chrysochromulina ericina, Strain CCMP281" /NCGR_SAMPLE_ID=MMETSP1096 /ASSEMBLY_ACC=CAM_ASM_000453 /LENGTH=64 /DNA_ID=CAMNT_0023337289 /DNA_START=87 /DNA_END=279 /DNA_ORIENTATION=-